MGAPVTAPLRASGALEKGKGKGGYPGLRPPMSHIREDVGSGRSQSSRGSEAAAPLLPVLRAARQANGERGAR
eukprot:6984597-Alexandrium_andersonii.AAC.1